MQPNGIEIIRGEGGNQEVYCFLCQALIAINFSDSYYSKKRIRRLKIRHTEVFHGGDRGFHPPTQLVTRETKGRTTDL